MNAPIHFIPWRRLLILTAVFVVLIGIAYWHDSAPLPAKQVSVPPGFTQSLVATGLDKPTSMAFAPDGRLFVTEQGGSVRIIKDGKLLKTPFLRLDVSPNPASGLLNLAFDPHFAKNQWVYLYYTMPTIPERDRLARVTAEGDAAAPDSETVLFESDALPSDPGLHHGGAIQFDGDDFLYLGTGDASKSQTAQALNTLFGKVLRLTRDGKPAPGNPFAQQVGARPEIFAYGFRNPYTFARSIKTGTILVNDVGEANWEEINILARGANYGWSLCEGKCADETGVMTNPVLEYGHKAADASSCAIIAGVFYQPPRTTFPAQYLDRYFYADLCGGWIRALDLANGTSQPFATGLDLPMDLEVGNDGALYALTRGAGRNYLAPSTSGQVWRIQY